VGFECEVGESRKVLQVVSARVSRTFVVRQAILTRQPRGLAFAEACLAGCPFYGNFPIHVSRSFRPRLLLPLLE